MQTCQVSRIRHETHAFEVYHGQQSSACWSSTLRRRRRRVNFIAWIMLVMCVTGYLNYFEDWGEAIFVIAYVVWGRIMHISLRFCSSRETYLSQFCYAVSPITASTKIIKLVVGRRITSRQPATGNVPSDWQRVYFYLLPWRRVHGNGCGDRRWFFISFRLMMMTTIDARLRCIILSMNISSLRSPPNPILHRVWQKCTLFSLR